MPRNTATAGTAVYLLVLDLERPNMNPKTRALWFIFMLTATVSLAAESESSIIFKKVTAAYGSLQTYSSEGTITSDMDTGFGRMKIDTSFSRLIDPKLEGTEQLEGEACDVISGRSTISKKETFWIAKKDHLIRKYSRALEPPEGGVTMPKKTDQQIEESIKALGQEVTEERKEAMKKMMQQAQDTIKTANLKGTSTELHTRIGALKFDPEDF